VVLVSGFPKGHRRAKANFGGGGKARLALTPPFRRPVPHGRAKGDAPVPGRPDWQVRVVPRFTGEWCALRGWWGQCIYDGRGGSPDALRPQMMALRDGAEAQLQVAAQVTPIAERPTSRRGRYVFGIPGTSTTIASHGDRSGPGCPHASPGLAGGSPSRECDGKRQKRGEVGVGRQDASATLASVPDADRPSAHRQAMCCR